MRGPVLMMGIEAWDWLHFQDFWYFDFRELFQLLADKLFVLACEACAHLYFNVKIFYKCKYFCKHIKLSVCTKTYLTLTELPIKMKIFERAGHGSAVRPVTLGLVVCNSEFGSLKIWCIWPFMKLHLLSKIFMHSPSREVTPECTKSNF